MPGVRTRARLAGTLLAGIILSLHLSGPSSISTQLAAQTASLPAPWFAVDITSLSPAGTSLSTNGTTFSITVGGSRSASSMDSWHFVYQQFVGNVVVTAKVDSLGASASSAAGVMIRSAAAANATYGAAMVSADPGTLFFQQQVKNGGKAARTFAAAMPSGWPRWVRAVRDGDKVTALYSTDRSNWVPLGSATIPLGTTAYIGIAATSGISGVATTAAVSEVSVVSLNWPPTVMLTEPASGTVFKANVPLRASASDPENRLDHVEFYADDNNFLGTATEPFSITWSSPPIGPHSLVARAFDLDGANATSAPSTIEVVASSIPATVVFHASSDHASLVTSYRLEVFATGSDPNTATPIASSDLGKPAPDVNGDITVDQLAFFNGLSPGTFIATVGAVGTGGVGRSAPVTFTR